MKNVIFFTFDLLFAVVSVGKAIVRVHVAVGVGSIRVAEGGVVVGGVSVVTSPHSGVVHPGISLGVSFSIGLSSGLGLSLRHTHSGLLNSSGGGGSGDNSGGYERSEGAGDEG